MATIRHERPGDAPAREALLDLAFGACRFTKSSQRLREGQEPAAGLSFVATVSFPSILGGIRAADRGHAIPPPVELCSAPSPARGGGLGRGLHGSARANHHKIVGAVRLWHVVVDERPALLLGPLAVHPDWRSRGIGGALMRRVLAEAERRGHGAVLLVGDAPYYARFGFSAAKTARLAMPGPFEPERLLACELRPGALDGVRGVIIAAPAHKLARLPQAA